MKVNNNNKKGSNAKKIIPAVGMLSVSAVMLASSTFAWFTMSREVEVKNIQMTASVPADTQISLGYLTNPGTEGLSGNAGTLTAGATGSGATADNGGVKAPHSGSTGADMLDWSNTADISAYYTLGKIIPASSINGTSVFYTPDAAGVGKTLKESHTFYPAVSTATQYKQGTSAELSDGEVSAKATLKATASTDLTAPKAWNDTNDGGYYVDIPIWIRTSNKDGAKFSVDAYVTNNTSGYAIDGDDLYKAVRVVIFDSTDDTYAGVPSTNLTNLVKVRNGGWDGKNIVDFYGRDLTTGAANSSLVSTKAAASSTTDYGAASTYDGSTVLDLQTAAKYKGTEGQYGEAKKFWIRVWLEGEDPNCWNENAGQDFNISLRFEDAAITPPAQDDDNSNPTAVAANDTTKVTLGSTELTFTYNGTVWSTTDTFPAAASGKKWQIGTGTSATVFTNDSDIATYLLANVTTKGQATTGVTISEVDA